MMGIAASPWQVQCTLAVRSASGCTQVAQRGAIVPDDTLEVLGALCARVDARQHVHLHTATWALSSGCRCRLRGCPALDIAEDTKITSNSTASPEKSGPSAVGASAAAATAPPRCAETSRCRDQALPWRCHRLPCSCTCTCDERCVASENNLQICEMSAARNNGSGCSTGVDHEAVGSHLAERRHVADRLS